MVPSVFCLQVMSYSVISIRNVSVFLWQTRCWLEKTLGSTVYGAQQTLDYSDEPVIIVHVSQSRERCLEAALRDFSQQLQIRLKTILG